MDPRTEDYQKVNPLAAVPAIDIGGARPMVQAGAILQYVVDRFHDQNLGSDRGPEARLEFNEIMSFLSGDFHPAFWPHLMPQRFTTSREESHLSAVQASSDALVERVLRHLDYLIGASDHVYRNKRTVADAYAYVMALWSVNLTKSWRDFPQLTRFMERMGEDPAVQKVLEASRR